MVINYFVWLISWIEMHFLSFKLRCIFTFLKPMWSDGHFKYLYSREGENNFNFNIIHGLFISICDLVCMFKIYYYLNVCFCLNIQYFNFPFENKSYISLFSQLTYFFKKRYKHFHLKPTLPSDLNKQATQKQV